MTGRARDTLKNLGIVGGALTPEPTPSPELLRKGKERAPEDEPEGVRAGRAMADDEQPQASSGTGGAPFDGTGDYASWKRGAKILSLTTGDPGRGAKAVFKLLRGPALDVATAHIDMDTITVFPFTNPQQIFRHLDTAYDTSGAEQKHEAVRQLTRLRQGSKDLGEFVEEFQVLAAKSGLDMEAKVAMLQAGVSPRLAPGAALIEEATLGGFVAKLRRLDQMTPKTDPRTRGYGHRGVKDRGTKGRQTSTRDPRDIVCFNCQKKGHYKKDCKSKRADARRAKNGRQEGEDKDPDDSDIEDLPGYSGKD